MSNPIEIFYIEDDVSIIQAVKEYFGQLNYKVTIFSRIEEAQKALLGYVPAIVLIDWNMTDGQGDSLCRWIRSKWEDLPIIFLTALSDTQNIISGFKEENEIIDGSDEVVIGGSVVDDLQKIIKAL